MLHGTSMLQNGDTSVYLAVLEAEIGAIRRHTDAPVILLVPDIAHPALVGAALATGVTDVLILPQMSETIAFSIEKARFGVARPATGPGVPRGEIVTVFSPKGGTGKTVLATNLGVYLATSSNLRVLLVDLDLQFGDAAIMLGLEPERTLSELVLAPGELDAGKLAGYTTRHSSGLAVLPAPMRPEEAELVGEQKLLEILEVARRAYDIVLVDTSPFFYGPMLATLEPTDHLLVVCGLDVPTLKNVRLSLRTLELLGFPASRLDLVLNRVSPKMGVTREDVETALETTVRFEIPNDPVGRAGRQPRRARGARGRDLAVHLRRRRDRAQVVPGRRRPPPRPSPPPRRRLGGACSTGRASACWKGDPDEPRGSPARRRQRAR